MKLIHKNAARLVGVCGAGFLGLFGVVERVDAAPVSEPLDSVLVAMQDLNLPKEWSVVSDSGSYLGKLFSLGNGVHNLSSRPDSCRLRDGVNGTNMQIFKSAVEGTVSQLAVNRNHTKAVALLLTPGTSPVLSVASEEFKGYLPECSNIEVSGDSNAYGHFNAKVNISPVPVPQVSATDIRRKVGYKIIVHATLEKPIQEIGTNKINAVFRFYSVLDRQIWISAVEVVPDGKNTLVPELAPVFSKQVEKVEKAR